MSNQNKEATTSFGQVHSLRRFGTRLLREIPWLIGLYVLASLIRDWFLGIHATTQKPIEIQDLDTYVIVSTNIIKAILFFALSIFMYGLRWLHSRAMTRRTVILAMTLTSIAFALMLWVWLVRLQEIGIAGNSLVRETDDVIRVQMRLVSYFALTLAAAVLALIDLTLVSKVFKTNTP